MDERVEAKLEAIGEKLEGIHVCAKEVVLRTVTAGGPLNDGVGFDLRLLQILMASQTLKWHLQLANALLGGILLVSFAYVLHHW